MSGDDKPRGGMRPYSAGVGVALGAGVGAALGVALDNIAVGVALGAGMGVAIGAPVVASPGRRRHLRGPA